METVLEPTKEKQGTLFNIETTQISPYWIDPKQPLLVPVNPLHYEAHKLQLLLARLERQAETNPAQFNSTNYINTLDRFTKLCEEITKGTRNDTLDSGELAENGDEGAASSVGHGNAPGMDSRVSADNPTAG